jgi:hypothetical protein
MPGEATPPRGTRNQKRSNGTECKNERSEAAITLGPEYQTVQNSAAKRRSSTPEPCGNRATMAGKASEAGSDRSFADCRNRRVRRQTGGYLKRCKGNGKGDSAPREHENAMIEG